MLRITHSTNNCAGIPIKTRGIISTMTDAIELPRVISSSLSMPGGMGAGVGAQKGKGGATAEQPSFFSRYKWILIIVAVFVGISSLINPETMKQLQQQQQGSR